MTYMRSWIDPLRAEVISTCSCRVSSGIVGRAAALDEAMTNGDPMSSEATARADRYQRRDGVMQALAGAAGWLVVVFSLRALGVTTRGSATDLLAGMVAFVFVAALTARRQSAARSPWPRAMLEAMVLALGAGAAYYVVLTR